MNRDFSGYHNFISLGANCFVAEDLASLGIRNASYPFDWCFSADFAGVIAAIENRFEGFVAYDELQQHKSNRSRYYNKKYKLSFYHDFNKFLPLRKQINQVEDKYNRRIERFYDSIKKPTIFFRYIISSQDYSYVQREYGHIKDMIESFCPENRIIYIVHKNFPEGLNAEYFLVSKDKNDWITRTPLKKNKNLKELLDVVDWIDKERNIAFENNKKPAKRKFSVEKTFRRLLKKEYIHNQTCDL